MAINWFKYSSPQTFYPLAGKMVPWFLVPCGRTWSGRSIHRFFCRAHRFSAGRVVPDHLHSRTGGVDVNVHLCGDGVLGWNRAGVQYAAVIDDGARAGADRRIDDLHRAVDRLVVGQAYLGHLVGVGCQADFRTDTAVPLYRLYVAGRGDRRSRGGPTRPPRCCRWRALSTFRSSIFPCSGGTRCTRVHR